MRAVVLEQAHEVFVVSQPLPLEAAPEADARFDERTGGCSKGVLEPGLAA